MKKDSAQEKYWDKAAEKKEFPTPFKIEEFEKFVSNEMNTLENSMNFRCPENRSQQTRSVCGVKTVSFDRFSRILDVGCGYGRTLDELYNHDFENLTGIDYSQGMINRGLRERPYLNLIKTDGDRIPFPDNEFDAVLLVAVLTSNTKDEEQENIISEISRVLKNGGILYLTDFLINQDKRNLERYQKYEDKYGIYGIFELPEGAVLRHHTEEHIFKLTKDFKKLLFEKTVFDTMNGHKSNGFYYIGKKK
jgi:ubiquinone/menaquinone biosynthesis C-methylase UbiE